MDDGFNAAMQKGGGVVLQRASTAKAKQAHAAADVSLNYLGYATQQGAWCIHVHIEARARTLAHGHMVHDHVLQQALTCVELTCETMHAHVHVQTHKCVKV